MMQHDKVYYNRSSAAWPRPGASWARPRATSAARSFYTYAYLLYNRLSFSES